jgi:hypothetical protein
MIRENTNIGICFNFNVDQLSILEKQIQLSVLYDIWIFRK